jgi:nitronate monooxygenase
MALHPLLERIGLEWPIFQAPMAGTSTPAMAAAVSNAGALGAIGLAAEGVEGAGKMIAATQALTNRPFNVNLFCHRPAIPDGAVEAAWIARLKPEFTALGAEPPSALREIYQTFRGNTAMTTLLLQARPAIVSFHFGLPQEDQIRALKQAGITLFGSATGLAEAQKLADAGLDAIVAQGYEAGGHRGSFSDSPGAGLVGTMALVPQIVDAVRVPVIAAGGIADGRGVAAAFALGASGAQLGTAFLGCPEATVSPLHRAQLRNAADDRTELTRAFTGRPARALRNRFITEMADAEPLGFPLQASLVGPLRQLPSEEARAEFTPFWAGQAASLIKEMPAGELVEQLVREAQSILGASA